ncbi:MAG TPA: glycosyltransferase [Pyrinomonadaceae bacterium]|nr:glycosyltransferase [Pyrinomonadaceae bacterium]
MIDSSQVALEQEAAQSLSRSGVELRAGTENSPLRVLHVHSGNLYGGVETTLIAQAGHREPGLNMQLSFALCFAGRFSEELAAIRAPVYWLGEVRVRNPLSVRRARQRLKSLLRQQAFDLVVTHSSWSQAIFGSIVRESGLPLVFWLHGAAQGRHWLERWASRTPPDLVMCNSHFTASTLPNLYRNRPSKVVYPPHDSKQVRPSITERLAIRAELETPPDAVVIVQVSRMESWKGHALHLEALSLLKDLPQWVCWQVGGAQRRSEARYLKALKNLAVKLGIADRVRFVGQRSDIAALLSAADIYCQPNTGPEPFGLTFIEALLAQLPVVTTAMGGAQEIIDDSCGLLTDPDPNALAASLKRLIEDAQLRMSMSVVGPARARKLCGVGTQLNRMNELFSELVRRDKV